MEPLFQFIKKEQIVESRSIQEKSQNKPPNIEVFEDFHYLKIEFLWGGMSIEIQKLQFTLCVRIDEDIIISSESHEEENLSLLDILPDKISGMVMAYVLLTLMET